MDVGLVSRAENKAAAACELEAFSGLNLVHVKRKIAELQRHIGSAGIFDEYTRHDIQHVNAMLAIVDWLAPAATQEVMTPADWLLVVLSIYVHDLGLLVGKQEFNDRYTSAFPAFRDSHLITHDGEGRDYAERLSILSPEDKERFLYQEFVRANHASRIRSWIDAPESARLGAAGRVAAEVAALFAHLDPVFRADLGTVCESHHLDDLERVEKYPIRRPYGNTPAEVANVQYAAILLRTADLLQITRDRAPSVAYRALTPADPLSQHEWVKNMAVRAVMPQVPRDRDGNARSDIQSSIVEVHAYFTDEDGFFGLTSYLSYAATQLDQSYRWAEDSIRRDGSVHHFPWRDIDTSAIETQGFLPKHFEFTLDQARILDLLTGHTLYNDTSVVIRELAQNAIDAVRLQFAAPNGRYSPTPAATVAIRWDSGQRILEVQDNGTGMTQEIIERHFLRVGASRYQDEKFREAFPEFSPISRFGIGVLSAFMIADSVEVFTCSESDAQVRQVSLRSVHGQYLIRLLEKGIDDRALALEPHGSLIRLRVRASADIGDVRTIAHSWFVLPGCTLTVQVDDQEPEAVGFSSLSEAIKTELIATRLVEPADLEEGRVRVKERQNGCVTVAYALRWSDWFQAWEFLALDPAAVAVLGDGPLRFPQRLFGLCVEGIRVEYDSPGYIRSNLVAMANASGQGTPRTNVARSGLEDTPELELLLSSIYRIYIDHISDEFTALTTKRSCSVSRASTECKYLLDTVAARSRHSVAEVRSRSALDEQARHLSILIMEEGGQRDTTSCSQLAERAAPFVTVDDPILQSAEMFLRYLPRSASLSRVLSAVESTEALPQRPLLLGFPQREDYLTDLLFNEWEVTAVQADDKAKRLLTTWGRTGAEPHWVHTGGLRTPRLDAFRHALERAFMPENRYGRDEMAILLPRGRVEVSGLEEYDAIRLGDCCFVLVSEALQSLTAAMPLEECSPITIDALAVVFEHMFVLARRLSPPAYLHRVAEQTLPLIRSSETIALVHELIPGDMVGLEAAVLHCPNVLNPAQFMAERRTVE